MHILCAFRLPIYEAPVGLGRRISQPVGKGLGSRFEPEAAEAAPGCGDGTMSESWRSDYATGAPIPREAGDGLILITGVVVSDGRYRIPALFG